MTLLARLQAATGPSYVLDVEIASLVHGKSMADVAALARPYTASIDAALSWMPEGAWLRSVHYDPHPRMEGKQWVASIVCGSTYRGEGRTMQGAINVAIAKARGIA